MNGLPARDVVILGAGMAGLTLARQLNRRDPDLDVTVLEHRSFPAPDAAFKVGESTVEIAAHYLAQNLGLEPHLAADQLPKFGLRLFCRGETPIEDDLARYDEIGVSKVLPVPTYQIDRGRFENTLAQICRRDGIRIDDGVTVTGVDLGERDHRVQTRQGTYRCRYLVDSTGRRAFLRRHLGLERDVRHQNQAAWFRVEGAVDIDCLSQDASWKARCCGTPRRLSTNHFTGPGYWVWVIPLSSGATSIGVVFDPKWLSAQKVASYEAFMKWITVEHPLLARLLRGLPVMDFHRMDRYAVGCREVFSPAGWMITGDAGNFADPFYSPGGDFIALSNTFVTELIAGGAEAQACRDFQSDFNAYFASTLGLYKGVYGGFGNRDLMVAKTLWDYSYYWGVLSKLFFSGRMTDRVFMAEINGDLQKAFAMNSTLQRGFRNTARSGERVGGTGRFYDQHDIRFFHDWKEDLLTGRAENDFSRLQSNISMLADVKSAVEDMLRQAQSGTATLPLSAFESTLAEAS